LYLILFIWHVPNHHTTNVRFPNLSKINFLELGSQFVDFLANDKDKIFNNFPFDIGYDQPSWIILCSRYILQRNSYFQLTRKLRKRSYKLPYCTNYFPHCNTSITPVYMRYKGMSRPRISSINSIQISPSIAGSNSEWITHLLIWW